MSLFGIVLGLALLIFLAFKGQSILWVAPVCAAVVALISMFAVSYTHLTLPTT